MKKIRLLILVFVLIFLVGCTTLPQFPFIGKQEKKEVGRGIRLYFLPGAPPTDRILVGQGSKFLVRVGIDNYGPAVTDATLKIWDNIPGPGDLEEKVGEKIDVNLKEAIFITSPTNSEQLINIEASKNVFPDSAVEFGYNSENIAPGTNLNIFAELFIPDYFVKIPTSFCLKRETAENVPCSNQDVVTSAKLGKQALYAPITVSRIEKIATPLGGDTFFVDLKIVLQNLGGGTIEKEDGSGKNIIDGFDIEVTSGNRDCAPRTIVFSNNEATVNCIIKDLSAGQSYTDHKMNIIYNFPYKMRIKAGPIPLVVFDRNN